MGSCAGGRRPRRPSAGKRGHVPPARRRHRAAWHGRGAGLRFGSARPDPARPVPSPWRWAQLGTARRCPAARFGSARLCSVVQLGFAPWHGWVLLCGTAWFCFMVPVRFALRGAACLCSMAQLGFARWHRMVLLHGTAWLCSTAQPGFALWRILVLLHGTSWFSSMAQPGFVLWHNLAFLCGTTGFCSVALFGSTLWHSLVLLCSSTWFRSVAHPGFPPWHSLVLPHGTAWFCPMAQSGFPPWHSQALPHGTVRLCPMAQPGFPPWHSLAFPHGTARTRCSDTAMPHTRCCLLPPDRPFPGVTKQPRSTVPCTRTRSELQPRCHHPHAQHSGLHPSPTQGACFATCVTPGVIPKARHGMDSFPPPPSPLAPPVPVTP